MKKASLVYFLSTALLEEQPSLTTSSSNTHLFYIFGLFLTLGFQSCYNSFFTTFAKNVILLVTNVGSHVPFKGCLKKFESNLWLLFCLFTQVHPHFYRYSSEL